MDWIFVVAAAVLGFVLGSVPVGLWVCALYGVDIRSVGSGRIGGTNAWRAAGLKAAIPTVLGDALKGAVAVILVRYLGRQFFPGMDSTLDALAASLAGGAAVWGHNRSLFLGFKGGGAGGITTAATMMAIAPLAGGIVWLTGALIIWWTRMASVGTFAVGACSLATLVFLYFVDRARWPWPYMLFGVLVFLAVTVALQRNRQALKDGKERIITIW
ncbi:MAG: glycerol-3-phosphate acyltransferase [Caldilineaceae bacterium]|nr:glycerol-3-phosphate acyltransferase [Caldilineaceae bacterium]